MCVSITTIFIRYGKFIFGIKTLFRETRDLTLLLNHLNQSTLEGINNRMGWKFPAYLISRGGGGVLINGGMENYVFKVNFQKQIYKYKQGKTKYEL